MENYVGRKIKGFSFKVEAENSPYAIAMKELIGKFGTITDQEIDKVLVDFGDSLEHDRYIFYPISKIEEHLIDEQLDSIVYAVRADLERRSYFGIKKYNTTLDRTDLTEIDWLNHAYEEALDLALYLKKTITLKQESK